MNRTYASHSFHFNGGTLEISTSVPLILIIHVWCVCLCVSRWCVYVDYGNYITVYKLKPTKAIIE